MKTIRAQAWTAFLLTIALRPAAAQESPPSTLTVDQIGELLAQASDEPLVLDQVSGITPEIALKLGEHLQGLSLDGLEALDPQSAGMLALHGRLTAGVPPDLDVEGLLGRIADLADGEDGPDFEGLERLVGDIGSGTSPGAEPDAAGGETDEPTAQTGDAWLSLGGLTSLAPEVAAALAMHEGPLLLDGVESLTVESAEALAAHAGELSLAGLKSLPADVRDALAAHDGTVVLPDDLVNAVADE